MKVAESLADQHFDVVVIGAGIAGSMAGLLCARAGLRTLLVDRQRFPRDKVCGGCVNGRALQLLKQAGLESGLTRLRPTVMSSLAIRSRGQTLDVPMPAGIAVSRRELDQWLVNEAVASGCRFLDEATASVEPLPGDSPGDGVGVPAFGSGGPPGDRTIALRLVNAPHDDDQTERVPSEASPLSLRVYAKIVLACDGLGHPSLHRLPAFRAPAQPGSRIGLGAVFPRAADDDWLRRGQVLMAVASQGYAGVVDIAHGQLNLAAAVDPADLNETKSPRHSLQRIFASAGVPVPRGLADAVIKGTVPLTRTARRVAGHRLFLLGDSTGYVEPFTGEGMGWALTAANAIVPLIASAVRDGWSDKLSARWRHECRSIVGREQRLCRVLTMALRRPWLLSPVLTTCRTFPAMSRHLIARINRMPEAFSEVR